MDITGCSGVVKVFNKSFSFFSVSERVLPKKILLVFDWMNIDHVIPTNIEKLAAKTKKVI